MKVLFNSSLFNDFIKKSKLIKSEGVQIRSANGQINLINCDLESQVSTTIMGDVYEQGSTIIPKEIFPLIKDNTPMTVTDEFITVGSRSIKYNYEDKYYPVIEDEFKYSVFDLNDKEVKQLLEVEHAISKDQTKPLLTGIRIDKNRFVAIDGFRFCERTGNFKTDIPISISDYKILKSLRGQIKATCSERYINYQVGNYNYSNRLLEGDFIEVDKLKPRDHNTIVRLEKSELENVLSSMKSVVSGNKNGLVMLGIKDNILHLKSSNKSVSVEDSIRCSVSGDNLEIGFNCKYLLEAIKDMHSTINMKFTTKVNPVILESPGKYELILPVRVASEV